MKGLRAKVDKNELPPYRFVEINGLRLPSPDHAYSVSFFWSHFGQGQQEEEEAIIVWHFSCNVNLKVLILISRPCSFLGTRKVQMFPKSINHEWKVPYVEGCEERAHFALPNEEIMTFHSGLWLVFLSMRLGTLVRDSICNTDMSWNWLITCVQVLHEALTGQHVGWRRALQSLDARFSETKPLKGMNARPCILLVDELDLLVTRNQSVLLLACLFCLRKCVLYVLTWMRFFVLLSNAETDQVCSDLCFAFSGTV